MRTRALALLLLCCLSAHPAIAADSIIDMLKKLPLPSRRTTEPAQSPPAKPAPQERPRGAESQRDDRTVSLSVPVESETGHFRTIALGGFQGNQGEQLTREVEVGVSQVRAGADGERLRVIPREDVNRALAGVRRDENWATEAGKRLDADAIVSGEVTNLRAVPTRTTKSQPKCLQRKPNASALQELIGADCQKWGSAQIACTQTQVNMQVLVRIHDTRASNRVRSEQVSGAAATESCPDSPGRSQDELLQAVRAQAAGRIVDLLKPRGAQVDVALMSADGSVQNPAARKQFSDALGFAANGRPDRACELLRAAFDVEKKSVPLTYDVGVCEESTGNAFEARRLYETADKMLGKADPLVDEALRRTERTIAARQKNAPAAAEATKTAATAVVVKEIEGKDAIARIAENIRHEKRVALVIGNAGYRKSALRNPVHDAEDMARALENLGFTVVRAQDADLKRMKQAIEEFASRLTPDGVALFYYAGHGVQVKGENYLIPLDADIKSENEVSYAAVNANEVLAKFESARTGVGIAILDACRDNPFSRSFRSQQKGLASIDAPKGVLIAYATAPGRTAQDGSDRNGIYTSQLLKVLQEPNIKVEDVFKRVRVGVTNATNGEQLPWEASSLVGDFYFSAQAQ